MNADILALLALALLAASITGWIIGLRKVELEGKRGLFLAAFASAFALSVLAFTQGPSWLGAMAAGFSLLGSGTFLGLSAISGQANKEPAVSVGKPILDFTAPLDDDTLFDSHTLHGRPFLLKFFRGHW